MEKCCNTLEKQVPQHEAKPLADPTRGQCKRRTSKSLCDRYNQREMAEGGASDSHEHSSKASQVENAKTTKLCILNDESYAQPEFKCLNADVNSCDNHLYPGKEENDQELVSRLSQGNTTTLQDSPTIDNSCTLQQNCQILQYSLTDAENTCPDISLKSCQSSSAALGFNLGSKSTNESIGVCGQHLVKCPSLGICADNTISKSKLESSEEYYCGHDVLSSVSDTSPGSKFRISCSSESPNSVISPLTGSKRGCSHKSFCNTINCSHEYLQPAVQFIPKHSKMLLGKPLFAKVYSQKEFKSIDKFSYILSLQIVNEAISLSVSLGWSIKCSAQCDQQLCREDYQRKEAPVRNNWSKDPKTGPDCTKFSTLAFSSCSSSLCWTPEVPYSPSHRSHSRRASRGSSLSFSHDSLICSGNANADVLDDSHYIKEAISHEALLSPCNKATSKKRKGSKCINDVYSSPVDTLKPFQGRVLQPKAIIQQPKLKYDLHSQKPPHPNKIQRPKDSNRTKRSHKPYSKRNNSKTLESNGTRTNGLIDENKKIRKVHSTTRTSSDEVECPKPLYAAEVQPPEQRRLCKIIPFTSLKPHRRKDTEEKMERKKGRGFSSSLRSTLLSLFTFRRSSKDHCNSVSAKTEFIDASLTTPDPCDGVRWGKICPLASAPPLRHSNKCSAFTDHVSASQRDNNNIGDSLSSATSGCLQRQPSNESPSNNLSCLGNNRSDKASGAVINRALPPLPNNSAGGCQQSDAIDKGDEGCDFASIIEKVKDHGWYWGPISGEAAEKVLSNEPDGSFMVRDSSDHHYIFSLTFRLNSVTRHVRIEHDQGNFSFGGFTRFKSQTIVDFIEKAVEHSRSGRYLFFLHRRPVLGPMRVQLLHPVSRFKHVQSLQHLCRFVIVKQVRRDLIGELPLPQRLKDYLSSPHYYSEQVEHCMSLSNTPSSATDTVHSHSPRPPSTEQQNLAAASAAPSRIRVSPHPRHHSLSRTHSERPRSKIKSHFSRRNIKCSFQNNPCSSAQPFIARKVENNGADYSRRLQRSSSHSSLEMPPCQEASFLTSPTAISSSSISSVSSWNKPPFLYPQRPSRPKLLSDQFVVPSSSWSSPSSPLMFDFSQFDWASSSDDQTLNRTAGIPSLPDSCNLTPSSLCASLQRQTLSSSYRRYLKEKKGASRQLFFSSTQTKSHEDNCYLAASASLDSRGLVSALTLDTLACLCDTIASSSNVEAFPKFVWSSL